MPCTPRPTARLFHCRMSTANFLAPICCAHVSCVYLLPRSPHVHPVHPYEASRKPAQKLLPHIKHLPLRKWMSKNCVHATQLGVETPGVRGLTATRRHDTCSRPSALWSCYFLAPATVILCFQGSGGLSRKSCAGLALKVLVRYSAHHL